jgi:hypothetical protein
MLIDEIEIIYFEVKINDLEIHKHNHHHYNCHDHQHNLMVEEKRLKTINDHQIHYDMLVLIIHMKIHVFRVHQLRVKHVQSILTEDKIELKIRKMTTDFFILFFNC